MYVILVVLDYDGCWDRFYSDPKEAAVRAEEISGTVVPWMVLSGPLPKNGEASRASKPTPQVQTGVVPPKPAGGRATP